MSSKRNKRRASLRTRLIAIFSIMLLFLTGLTFLWTYNSLEKELDKRIMNNLRLRYEIIGEEYNEEIEHKDHHRHHHSKDGIEEVREMLEEQQQILTYTREWVYLLDKTGNILLNSNTPEMQVNHKRVLQKLTLPAESYYGRGFDGGYHYLYLIKKNHDNSYLFLAADLQENRNLMTHYRHIFLISFFVIAIFGGLLCARIITTSLEGFQKIQRTVETITQQGDYSHRVEISSAAGREVAGLAESCNSMLTRTQSLLKEIKDVTNNVAHDLRTPLTRIRGQVETTLLQASDINDYQETSGIVIEECDNLISIINDMLTLAEHESGLVPQKKNSFILNEVLTNLVEVFSCVAEDKDIKLLLNQTEQKLSVSGDIKTIQRALSNLVDNAVKYSPNETQIEIQLSESDGKARIDIQDQGCGISGDDKKRIFERFYRVEKSRNNPGNGLGLNLAKAFIENHGGSLSLISSPGEGSTFTVILPI